VITRKKRIWLIGLAISATIAAVAIIIVARVVASHFEPYIREQAIQYLQQRFDSDVELSALHVYVPNISPLKLAMNRGRGVLARVEGEGVALRHRGRRDIPPMFLMKSFGFSVDLGALGDPEKSVTSITIDGMEINIPPKGQRPDIDQDDDQPEAEEPNTGVIIQEVVITNSTLRILPREQHKTPLKFDLHRVRLEAAGMNVAMKYDATLTNAKPPGEIQSKGTFGPWAATEPGDTPLSGEYDFKDADLGIFNEIAGILHSTGQFEGTLDSIEVKGEATVPDFRLKDAGNPVRLLTKFNVLVDGTNGNTVLKPVIGTLGTTTFTTSGGVIKHEDVDRRGISLDVTMPDGSIKDMLTLAMKGPAFMEGRISLKTKIDIPPLSGKVKQKLLLDGTFHLSQGKFLRSKIQDQIDSFSRRGQGKPKDETISDVPTDMAGSFKMTNGVVTFRSLSFSVPGAGVDLMGNYDLRKDGIDFHGTLKLQAKVSQTMTGWKRWVLKPIDPFFSKQGAGTLIRIQVTGTSKDPKFGRDRGKKDENP
jgi:hypothetical protein